MSHVFPHESSEAIKFILQKNTMTGVEIELLCYGGIKKALLTLNVCLTAKVCYNVSLF